MPVAELAIPGAHNVSNALAAIAVALAFGIEPEAIRSAAAAFTGVEHRLEPAGVIDGVRFINDSQGTQPDAVIAALRAFEPPIVLIAGGRDKGIDLTALAPVVAERAVAAVLIGESGPTLEASFRAAGLARTERADRPRGRGPPRGRHRARRPGRPAGRRARRPCCSARPPPASTCSRTTPRAAARSRPRSRPWPRPAREAATDEPRPADPAPRAAAPDSRTRRRDRALANRTPVKSRAGAVRRESHSADYVILVVVVALTAIGILMVYSSSALKGYMSQDADTFATVGPQIQWAILGIVAMALMMRVDYRYLRLASVPFYIVAVVLLVLVFVPQLNIVVGGSARWLKLGPLPAIHPAEIAKLALVIYLAHWFAKRGKRVHGFWAGTVPFLIIAAPIIALVFKEPDLGTTVVITLTAFTMFFVAGANLVHLAVMGGVGVLAMIVVGLQGYQLERIRVWQDPWLDRLGAGFHTIQGLLALGIGGLFGTGLGESKVFVPNAFNDFIFAEVGQEFGLVGAVVVIALFLILAYSGVRVALGAPDTFGALLAAGITAWLCLQAFINIGVVVALLPITGITLPFISAGGSSLIISFAAVGILLSISRETVEKGTWNDDAIADRGGRDGRTHLPGARRRPVAQRQP